MAAAGRAADEIRLAIAAAGGAIPFARFMDLALYGASGFYTAGGRRRAARRLPDRRRRSGRCSAR